jgi:hypothetical protein
MYVIQLNCYWFCFTVIKCDYYLLSDSPSKSRDKHHDKHKSSSSSGKKRSREDSSSRDKHSKRR